jgi:uncharacterized protein (UPF0333 family)
MSWFSGKPKVLSSVSAVEDVAVMKNRAAAIAAANEKARQTMKNRFVAKLPTHNLGSNKGAMASYKNTVFGVNRTIMGNTRNINTWKANQRATKGGKSRRNRKNRTRKNRK